MSQTIPRFTTDQSSGANLTENERHELLRKERRRMVLDILADQSTPVTLAELVDEIAGREDDSVADENTVKQIRISLHHVHLPQMNEFGIISYDGESNTITH